jgi:hypothetical protein
VGLPSLTLVTAFAMQGADSMAIRAGTIIARFATAMIAIDDPASADRTTCPFLVPTRRPGRSESAVGIFCRFAGGRIRVPPSDEILTYCVGGVWSRWNRCLAYSRHAFDATPPIVA